jgi:hypothetical protein
MVTFIYAAVGTWNLTFRRVFCVSHDCLLIKGYSGNVVTKGTEVSGARSSNRPPTCLSSSYTYVQLCVVMTLWTDCTKLVYVRCYWLTWDPTAMHGTYQSQPNICMCLDLLVPHVHVESNGTECLISFEMERSQNRVKERVVRVDVGLRRERLTVLSTECGCFPWRSGCSIPMLLDHSNNSKTFSKFKFHAIS